MTKEEKRAALLAGIEARPDDAALSVDEAAAILGISRWTAVPLFEAGTLPAFVLKSGQRKRIWRIRKGALMRWIQHREMEAKRSARTARPVFSVVDDGSQPKDGAVPLKAV